MISYPKTRWRSDDDVRKDIDAIVAGLRQQAGTGLHLGCGHARIEGMINCDKFSELADRKVDASDLSEFVDESVDLIEHHHMIEHLSFTEAAAAVREWARVLRPGGWIIITCPNLDWVIKKWQASVDEERWGYVIKMIFGSQEHEGMFHRSGYNEGRMRRLLGSHGIQVEFAFTPYPQRPTPSLLVIGRKVNADA